MRLARLKRSAGCSLVLLAALAVAAAPTANAVTTLAAPAAAATAAAVAPFRLVTSITAPGATENRLLLAAKSRIDAKQAAATVKQKLGGKVLSVKLIESKGPPVYRIKTLSKSGVVKVVFVDGQSGKVFD